MQCVRDRGIGLSKRTGGRCPRCSPLKERPPSPGGVHRPTSAGERLASRRWDRARQGSSQTLANVAGVPPFLIHKCKSIIVGPEWYTAAASLSCQFRDVEVCGVELSGLLEAIPILDDHPGARTCDGGN